MQQEPELKDYEFGCYYFETLPKAKGAEVGKPLTLVDGVQICEINISYDNAENSQLSVKLPLTDTQFSCLQKKDPKLKSLCKKVQNGLYKEFYFVENDILYRTIIDNGQKFNAAVILDELTDTVLFLGHNQSAHNGYQRTYAAIKWSYYWKGMRKHILVHCKTCVTCVKQKHSKNTIQTANIQTRCTTNGIHVHQSHWRIPSSLLQKEQIHINCHLYVDRFYILYSHQE